MFVNDGWNNQVSEKYVTVKVAYIMFIVFQGIRIVNLQTFDVRYGEIFSKYSTFW